jgi:hypothetical protein
MDYFIMTMPAISMFGMGVVGVDPDLNDFDFDANLADERMAADSPDGPSRAQGPHLVTGAILLLRRPSGSKLVLRAS